MPTYNELLKILKKEGWFLDKHGSNHDHYRNLKKEGLIIFPRHGSKEVAKGTLKSILKAAGLKKNSK